MFLLQVDTSNVQVRPVLTYPQGTALPSGVTSARDNVLPACAALTIDPSSGVGDCAVAVAARFFPASGQSTVQVGLQVLLG